MSTPFDITDDMQHQSAGADALAHRHPGPTPQSPVTWPQSDSANLPPGRWRSYIDINLYGSLHCIAAGDRADGDRHWGQITPPAPGAGTSISGLRASSSIEGFIRHLSTEVAATGAGHSERARSGLMAAPNKPRFPVSRRASPGWLERRTTSGAAVSVPRLRYEAEWMTGQTVEPQQQIHFQRPANGQGRRHVDLAGTGLWRAANCAMAKCGGGASAANSTTELHRALDPNVSGDIVSLPSKTTPATKRTASNRIPDISG